VSDLPHQRAAHQFAPSIEADPAIEESVVTIGEPPSAGRRIVVEGSIGATLREARLEAGLTTYELAQTTHIQAARLIEIESDDFTACGASVLARGRLAAIARAVGVDPQPLLEAFDAAQGSGETPAEPPKVAPAVPQIGPGRTNWTSVLLWALAVLALYPFALLCAHVFA
jgi:cytoskeletal protein RodZ